MLHAWFVLVMANGGVPRFVVTGEPEVFRAQVNPRFTTTLSFDFPCGEPALGDTTFFEVIHDTKRKRKTRFVVGTGTGVAVGTKTNLTFVCEDGLNVVVALEVVPEDRVHHAVEFSRSPELMRSLRVQADAVRRHERQRYRAQLQAARVAIREEVARELHLSMLSRSRVSRDVERGRSGFVIVEVHEPLVIGDRAYLTYEVLNRSTRIFEFHSAEALEEEHRSALPVIASEYSTPAVARDASARGLLVLDVGGHAPTVTLVVHGKDGRKVEVNDVEL